tara:strand:- start:377 stop:1078 length:702 start_codon:yes stop_codon:yes gene_type:complete
MQRVAESLSEIMDIIFKGVLDNWITTAPYRHDVFQRAHRGCIPQRHRYRSAHIAIEPYPLVLTPDSCLAQQRSGSGMPWLLAAHQRAPLVAAYARYKHRLLEIGHINSRYRATYRNFLVRHVKFYVNIAEIGRFLDTFHPDIFPPPSLIPRYTSRRFVMIFPWYTRRMWDIFLFVASLVRAQRLQVGEVWAINPAPAGEIDSWSANLSLSIRFNRLTASIHGEIFSTNYPTNR